MAREENTNIVNELSQEELEQIEEQQEELEEDNREDSFEDNQELQEEYGYPQLEEKHNAHAIIAKSLDKIDTVRTTYLTESELGRPLFSVRFLSDLHDDAKRCDLERLENYYWEKIQNITSSGMSNKGFVMNLNVTQKRDTTRRKTRELPQKELETKK